jgi:hypothetical protein
MRHGRLWFLLALVAVLVAAAIVLHRLGDADNILPTEFGEPRQPPPVEDLPDPVLESAEKGPPEDGYIPVRMLTSRGAIDGRYCSAPGARQAVIWVGGTGGGWDTPAHDLYPRLCDDLRGQGISSLRVRFRQPKNLSESVADVLTGVAFLQGEGIEAVALVGHSFGGAVVIRAAARAPAVCTVITLATQSYGADPVEQLGPRCSMLLIHGTADQVLPAACTERVFRRAKERKRIHLLPGANHGLDEAADKVGQLVREWVLEQMRWPGD